MASSHEDVLARLEAMMAAQEERIARLQAEVERQREEKRSLTARLNELEGKGESRLSRAGLFKVAAAGAAGLLGAGALENNGTGVALADSPPTTFTSTGTSPAVTAQNTATSSGGHGCAGGTKDSTKAGIYGFNSTAGDGVLGQSTGGPGVHGKTSGTGPGVRGDGPAGGIGVYGVNSNTSTPGNGVRGESYGANELDPNSAGVAGYNYRLVNGQALPGTGVGVFGQCGAGGIGVYGASTDDNGNIGYGNGEGVHGESYAGTGVTGISYNNGGVEGHSAYSSGVIGTTDNGSEGVYGSSARFGVHGIGSGQAATHGPINSAGVWGEGLHGTIGVLGLTRDTSASGPAPLNPSSPPQIPNDVTVTAAQVGVRGFSYTNTHGVAGISFADPQEDTLGSGIGVQGWSGSGFGMLGKSTSSTGVLGQSQNWYGVQGNSVYGDGVYGVSTHLYGAEVTGGKAPLRLVPSGSAGAPSASGHKAGELYVDSTGILYYFNGTAWKVVQIA